MNWCILILGSLMCALSLTGVAYDQNPYQNPSLGRVITYIALQVFGFVLLGYGLSRVSL